MIVKPGDFTDPQVVALLQAHLLGVRGILPPENVYALDASELQAPDISFYAAWDRDILLGIGALKQLSAGAGEIKSMRTDPDHLRKGVGWRLLDHLVSIAHTRGYQRVSLETGFGAAFEPALALYRRYGFTNGEVFGDYKPSPFNQFLHLSL